MEDWVDSLSDEQLVALTQDGNLQAFNRLTARWESSLYRFALRLVGNREDARDVCQEALMKAYLNIQKLREGAKFKSWVHHILLNLCRDRFRSAGAKADIQPFEEDGIQETRVAMTRAREAGVSEAAERISLSHLLEEVMGLLPMEQRSAILLREYHGFTSEEIAEIVGVPAATVRTRIFYGLRSVRRMLTERGVEVPMHS